MFQFPTSRPNTLCIHVLVVTSYGYWVPPFGYARVFTDICSSTSLFAACHVLYRLLMPRHSPYALISLTYFFFSDFHYNTCNFACYLYIIYFSMCSSECFKQPYGGDEESRTPDLVLARHALYQLSYAPMLVV